MKALLLEGKGKVSEMKVGNIQKPHPAKGEILVKIKATALNPVDYKTGNGGNPSWTYPHVLGLDSAGVVEEVGEEVTTVKVGDRVVAGSHLFRCSRRSLRLALQSTARSS